MSSPYDFASLADVKTWLDVRGDDDDILLSRLVTRISRAILSLLDRPSILPTVYAETYDGGGGRSIMLRQWPANAILSCAVNGAPVPAAPPPVAGAAFYPGYVLDDSETAPPGRMQRLSLRGRRFPCGVRNVSVSYSAGYQITDEAIIAPSAAPFSVEVEAPYGDWASDGGVRYSDGAALTAVAASPARGQYTVANGVYVFADADAGASMSATYGYVPADLAICCMDWAAERYLYRSRIGQQSKSLGGQETVSYIVKEAPDFVLYSLQPYRRIAAP